MMARETPSVWLQFTSPTLLPISSITLLWTPSTHPLVQPTVLTPLPFQDLCMGCFLLGTFCPQLIPPHHLALTTRAKVMPPPITLYFILLLP